MVYHLSIDLLALKLRDGGSIFPTGWLYFSVRVALKLRDGGFFRPIFVTRKYASFILAAPYDLEAKIQKSDENITNSQLYRRCPAHMMTGMPDEQARQLLAYAEEDFNIKLDNIVKKKLLQRIHQI